MENVKTLLTEELEYARHNLEKSFQMLRNNRVSKHIDLEWTEEEENAYYLGYEKAMENCIRILKEKEVI